MEEFLEDMRTWMKNNPISKSEMKNLRESLNIEVVPSFPIFRGCEHPRYGVKHTSETKLLIKEKRSKQIVSHSEETKLKISLSNKGKVKSEEHRMKLSEAQKSKKGTYTETRLAKMKEVSSLGNNHKAKKIVAEWKDGKTKEYDCIKSFVLDTNINYESAKLLARHGKFSRTHHVRLICL